MIKNINGQDILKSIDNKDETEDILELSNALASKVRLDFLRQLINNPMTITELAKANGMANSTVIFHLNVLVNAGLVKVEYLPSKKGKAQVYFAHFTSINFSLFNKKKLTFLPNEKKLETHEQSMPVGMFVEANVDDYIRFATEKDIIRLSKNEIYDNIRQEIELLWTNGGKISYAFTNSFAINQDVEEIEFSLELCSEINYYRNDWKSDITFAVNNIDICTYTSPGDFGGIKGKLNPAWWGTSATQFGLLVVVTINKEGVFLNRNLVKTEITINDLNLYSDNKILFTIYNRKDAEHYGGFNIFGKKFGNYPQDIILRAHYHNK